MTDFVSDAERPGRNCAFVLAWTEYDEPIYLRSAMIATIKPEEGIDTDGNPFDGVRVAMSNGDEHLVMALAFDFLAVVLRREIHRD